MVWIGCRWLSETGSCNQNIRSMKGGEFYDELSDCKLTNEDSSPWSSLIIINNSRVVRLMINITRNGFNV